MDYNQEVAIKVYENKFGRTFVPGEIVDVPVDALLFSVYQMPWKTLEEYRKARCIYDAETNDELIYLVTTLLREPEIPPIYVDILSDGVALVDGTHRVTAALIAGDVTIPAQLNQHSTATRR